MISLTLRVVTDTAEGEYQVGPKVQVAFEREWKVGMAKAFNEDQRMEHIYWLGWKAMHAAGEVVKPFDEWLETVREVEMVAAADGPLSPME